MQWVLLLVIVAALLYLARYFPKVAFSVLGALVVGALIVIILSTDGARLDRAKLPTDSIVIDNAVVSKAYGGGYRLNARLQNTHEKFDLKDAVISITMLDCKGSEQSDCQIIGQESERIIIQIPAGQSRDISQVFSFTSANPENELRWKFAVTETRS